jgi:hypothetical protein
MEANPSDAVPAFTEYAEDRWWVASHLTQLEGIMLMNSALLILAQQMEAVRTKGLVIYHCGKPGRETGSGRALQVVDGTAPKATADAQQRCNTSWKFRLPGHSRR